MSQGRDTKRPESLEELLDEENVAPNAPSGSPREKSGDEKRVLETLIFAQEDEAGHLAEVKEMLKNNDPRLKFVLDGDAIENPFAVDQEAQLQYLMDSFCEMKVDGGYKCVVCDDEWKDLEMMHQHLLTHSNSKFYLCVLCLEGFNTLSGMHLHTATHNDESALPPSIQDYLDKLRSTEGPESPQYSKPKEPKKHSAKEKCERDYRCIICGFNSSRLDVLLLHTEQKHPTERDVIGRLRLRLLHAAFNPKGYRFDNADEEVEEEEEEEGT